MAEEKEEKKEINIFESKLLPQIVLLTEDQKDIFLEKYNVSLKQLPRMKHEDPVAKRLGAKRGDVVHIVRKSDIGPVEYFRVVV